jgi:hypothetical protein
MRIATFRAARDLTLAGLGVTCLLAPAVMTFASSRPVAVRVVPERAPVIHVELFQDLAAGSCLPDPRLHLGPSSIEGKLSDAGSLRALMTAAVSRCDGDWFGHVALSVKVDEAGSIRDVRADAGGDGRMSTCVIRNMMRDGPVETRGPGTLTIGYFMGTRPI